MKQEATRQSQLKYFLDQNVPDYISKDYWPAKSLDLNPLDYSIWGAMDELVSCSGHKTNDIESFELAIKEQLGKLFHKIP